MAPLANSAMVAAKAAPVNPQPNGKINSQPSITVMIAAKKYKWFSEIGVSILGGIFHNIGQLPVAALIAGTGGDFSYLPVLLVAGVITGGVIGLLGGLVVERLLPMVERI